jgi:predicted acetyltransferase
MPRLADPTVSVHESFVESLREVDLRPGVLTDPAEFAAYVRRLIEQKFAETPRPVGHVPGTTLWWIDGRQFLGRLTIRHRLTPSLERQGGHIGYDVRPSARRKGHATAMLRAALPKARELGIDRALITCDADNIGSRKVIERNGGEFVDEIDGIFRFRVPT